MRGLRSQLSSALRDVEKQERGIQRGGNCLLSIRATSPALDQGRLGLGSALLHIVAEKRIQFVAGSRTGESVEFALLRNQFGSLHKSTPR